MEQSTESPARIDGGEVKRGGKGEAVAGLILGVLSIVVMCAGGYSVYGLLSMLFGITGLSAAVEARKDGYDSDMRMAGFILSMMGTVLPVIAIAIYYHYPDGIDALLKLLDGIGQLSGLFRG